jgi:hypothetical protein
MTLTLTCQKYAMGDSTAVNLFYTHRGSSMLPIDPQQWAQNDKCHLQKQGKWNTAAALTWSPDPTSIWRRKPALSGPWESSGPSALGSVFDVDSLHLGNFSLSFSTHDCDMQISDVLNAPFLVLRSHKDVLVGTYIVHHHEPLMFQTHIPPWTGN